MSAKPYEDVSIVIKQVEEVAVYENENGDVVISQEDSGQQEYHAIIFQKNRAKDIVDAIKRIATDK